MQYRCPLCHSPMRPGRCADLAVLVCVGCGKTVETSVAAEACVAVQVAPSGVRFTARGDIYVPTTNPRLAGLDIGYIVSADLSSCNCTKDRCRHVAAARKFLKTLSLSPDGLTPLPPSSPSTPASAARPSGRAGRAVSVEQ